MKMALLALTCPHCHVTNTQFHSVVQVRRRDGGHTVAFVCNACEHGVVADVSVLGQHHPSPHDYSGDLYRETKYYRINRLYPRSLDVVAPEHSPENVAYYYKQAQDSLKRKHFDAAGAMYRKTLDIAIKKLDAALKGDLKTRIDKLAEAAKI